MSATTTPAPIEPRTRRRMRWLMIAAYGFVGILHLTATERLLPIMPDWVPEPHLVVQATGLCEVLGALALFVPRLRRAAGILFALYAVCVFPANLKHAFAHVAVPPIPDSWWYHGPRLAMQPVLIWWSLFATQVVSWPFGNDTDRRRDRIR